MRVLLTGAGGFVGSQVARALVERGDETLVVLRSSTPRDRIQDLVRRLRVLEADLEDESTLAGGFEGFRPEIVLHAAWYARPGDYLTSPENLRSLNVTTRLAQRAFAAGCRRFVGVGTCLEYAPSDSRRRDADPVEPKTLYAACKLAAWQVVRSLAGQHGAQSVWARLFHVHGPGEAPDRLVPSVARALAGGQPFDLSPGDQVRDQLHVKDVADALVHLAAGEATGVFNVCSGEPVTLRQVATAVGQALGRADLLRFGARCYAPGELMFLAGDPARLRATGWRPRVTDLAAGIADAVVGYVAANRR